MKVPKIVGWLLTILGLLMLIGGIVSYATVSSQLADQGITVAEDAPFLAGDKVDGPFSAWAEQSIIAEHTAAATGGKTYAELDREDPNRTTAFNGSMLRSSLFTSILAFGLSALISGLGLLTALTGWALTKLANAFHGHDHDHLVGNRRVVADTTTTTTVDGAHAVND